MRRIVLTLTVMAMITYANAQSDSINTKMNPPDVNIDRNNDINNEINGNKRYYKNNSNRSDSVDRRNHSDSSSYNKNKRYSDADGYLVRNGKMMYIKNDSIMPMKKNRKLRNGIKIMTDGSYITKNGDRKMLDNGQHLDGTGKTFTSQ